MRTTAGILFIALVSLLTLLGVNWLYDHNHSTSSVNPNAVLTHINYSVQIAYNVIYLVIAISVLVIAARQLRKTRESTSIQALTTILSNMKAADFLQKRRTLARFILEQERSNTIGLNNLRIWMTDIQSKSVLSAAELEEVAYVKNLFESVIYEYEILGYYYYKKINSLEDIYELFSYELQRYWAIAYQSGYITYLRHNALNGALDYYDKFEKLHHATVKYELVQNRRWKWAWIVYYYCGLYRPVHYLQRIAEKRIGWPFFLRAW